MLYNRDVIRCDMVDFLLMVTRLQHLIKLVKIVVKKLIIGQHTEEPKQHYCNSNCMNTIEDL